jgi:hypothetical protein
VKNTFFRSHLVAWIAALVFGWLSAIALFLVPPYHPGAIVIPWIVSVLLICGVALILGRYDQLVILAGACSVALSFGIRYAMSVSVFLPDDGHTMFNVLMDGAHPFALWAQARLFAIFFIWAATVVGTGLALKRWMRLSPAGPGVSSNLVPDPKEKSKIWRWLAFDFALIFCITFGMLRHEVMEREVQGTPAYLTQTLESPTSTGIERLNAIRELSMGDTGESIQALRRAAAQDQPPINLIAAAALLDRNDISGLPVVEQFALQSPPADGGSIELESTLADIKNPAALPVLVKLMTSSSSGTRRGAARALYNINSQGAIPALIKGLDDSEQEVKCWSIRGLGRLVKPHDDKWDGFHGDLRSNLSLYVDHWKTWARENYPAGR